MPKTFGQKLQKKLFYIDIFGISPHMYVGNHKNFRTKYGVCFTIFLIFISISCVYIFGKDLIFRENPAITIEEKYSVQPEYFKIDKDTLNFA